MEQNKQNDEMMWVGLGILLVIIVFGLWFFAREVIVWMILGPDMAQLHILNFATGLNDTGRQTLEYAKSLFDGRNDPSTVEWPTLVLISSMVGSSFRLPIAGLITLMAMVTLVRMRGTGLSRSFSLAGGKGKGPSLAHYQAREWGPVVTSAHFDPNACTAEELPAKTPLEWMRDNKISLTETEGLDRTAAEAAFEAQLGAPWEGFDKAPIHIQAMLIMCILNANRAKEKDDIKSEIARIWTLDRKNAEKKTARLLKKYMKDEKVLEEIDACMSKHHYTTTGLYRLLIWARRTGGIFACAEFRWMKPVDRNLWYTLQNAGRRAYLIEGAGPVAHYQVEFLSGRPVPSPKVISAVDGLEAFLEVHHITNLERMFQKGKI